MFGFWYKNILPFFLIYFLYACSPAISKLDGKWEGGGILVTIDSKQKRITYTNLSESKENFSEKISSFDKNLEDKWQLVLSNKKILTMKTFNNDTLFLYSKTSYIRLKKNN